MTRAWPLKPDIPYKQRNKLWWDMRTFCTTINQRLETLWILWIYQVYESRINPSSSFHRIETANDQVKLHVVIVILVLDLSIVSEEAIRTSHIVCRAAHGVTFTPGTRFMMNSAATIAFGFPTSFCLYGSQLTSTHARTVTKDHT